METIVQTPVFTFPFLGTLTGVLFWWQCSSLEAGDKDYTKGYVSFKRLDLLHASWNGAGFSLFDHWRSFSWGE